MRTIKELSELVSKRPALAPRVEWKKGAAGDTGIYTVTFVAVIGASKPMIPTLPDEDPLLKFPKLYEWTAPFGWPARSARMAGVVVRHDDPPAPDECLNLIDDDYGLAVNRSEFFADANIHQNIVPPGMPVIMCFSFPHGLYDPLRPCSGLPGGNILTERPPPIWFDHYMDPQSEICDEQ